MLLIFPFIPLLSHGYVISRPTASSIQFFGELNKTANFNFLVLLQNLNFE